MVYLIAICGGSGSGKTLLSTALREHFGADCPVLPYDNYYKDQSHLPMEERAKQNYDDPEILDAALYQEHLKACKEGKSVEVPQYDFTTHTRKKETVTFHPTKIVICEGIMVMQLPLELYDGTIFVQADSDVRLARRIFRDMKERGRTAESVINQYFATVKPMHRKYVSPMKKKAGFLFENNGNNGIEKPHFEELLRYLETIIK